MAQRIVSVSFSQKNETEMQLFEAIRESPAPLVKAALAFWLRYRNLLPELDNTADLASNVAVLAGLVREQSERLAAIERMLKNGGQVGGSLEVQPLEDNPKFGRQQADYMEEYDPK